MTCIIVRHGAYEDYGRVSALFGREVPIVWDRRPPRNRPDTAPSARNPNRREKPSPSWTELGFVVVDRSAAWTRAAVHEPEYLVRDDGDADTGLDPVSWTVVEPDGMIDDLGRESIAVDRNSGN